VGRIRIIVLAILLLLVPSPISDYSEFWRPSYPCKTFRGPNGDWVMMEPGGEMVLREGFIDEKEEKR